MFNKLRNRFLLVNMALISLIMLLAFGAIYTITTQYVRSDIEMELRRVSEFHRKPSAPFGQQRPGGGLPSQEQPPSDGTAGPFNRPEPAYSGSPPERSASFSMQTDVGWTITGIDSRFAMDDGFYESAKQKVAASGKSSGTFRLDGDSWAYSIEPNTEGYSIVYLDVTSRHNILLNLMYTFGAVGLVMLLAIYGVSRYFASRSIKPVREAFEKQKRFIADASHELKTPLTVINTNADVLLANREDAISGHAKWLERIKSETERMKTLTNDLLYLTEMEETRSPMMTAPFCVSEAVESVILTMEAVIFEKSIALTWDIQPGLTATGNSEYMKQAVMILLDNAVKYTDAHGSITVTLKKRGNEIVLAVANTGDDIASEHLDRLFDRFYRVDPSRTRKRGGYGLGLAIAKSIVEQHRGKIYARSSAGVTTFYVHLHA